MKKWFKKRILSKKTAIITSIVAFGLILPNIAQAFVYQFLQIFKAGGEMTAAAIARAILSITAEFVFNLLNWLVRAGADFFNGMLNIGFTSHLDVVKAGWQVTRDFSNMFFILFLVIIAFATILRTEKYGIKQLLPKIILIALLINFSLVICSVIIDFSNITANFFIKDIKQYAGKGGISGNFVDSLNLVKTQTILDCDELSDDPVWPLGGVGPPDPGPSLRQKCLESQETLAATQVGSDIITFVISMTVGSLVMLVAAFTLFAGGMLLLIRVVIVWFLVMLVPLVFICYIMPALRQNWQKWWKAFLQWCFFAPAYAFFIWLAMKVSIEAGTKEIVKEVSTGFTDIGPLTNVFLSTPANALIQYFFIIALLLGGLIAAQKFGFYGANTAMKIGKGIYKGTARWTGARIRERAAKPAAGLAGGLARAFGRVPGLRKLALAPAQVMAKQREDIDKEKKKLSVHTPDTLKSLYPSFRGNRSQQVAMAEILAEKNSLKDGKNLREKDIGQLMKLSDLYGKSDVLLKNRPDLAPTIGKDIKEVTAKLSPADMEKLQSKAVENKVVQDTLLEKGRPAHLSKIATTNIKVMDKLQEAIDRLGTTADEKRRALEQINPRLAKYIDSNAGQSLGWSFEKPAPPEMPFTMA